MSLPKGWRRIESREELEEVLERKVTIKFVTPGLGKQKQQFEGAVIGPSLDAGGFRFQITNGPTIKVEPGDLIVQESQPLEVVL